MADDKNKESDLINNATGGAATIAGLGASVDLTSNAAAVGTALAEAGAAIAMNTHTNATEYPTTSAPMYVPAVKKKDRDPYRRDNTNIAYETPYGLITPEDHFAPDPNNLKSGVKVKPNPAAPPYTANYFVRNPEDHFIRDHRQNLEGEEHAGFGGGSQYSSFGTRSMINEDAPVERMGSISKDTIRAVGVFSGSTTDVNPHDDPTSEAIIESGTLSRYLEETNRKEELGDYRLPPISPIHPFMRMNSLETPYAASEAMFTAYNRTRLPVADTAWRKGFRYIFITRPECYVWYGGINGGMCDQAANDEDFASAFTRMPHIIKLLAPRYVSGSYPKNQTDANWNFLLSNLVQGLTTSASTMNISENIVKSLGGYTITPAAGLEGRQGSTLELTFKDTRYLEVYEFIRLWQLYMYKRKKGIFAPPFNGYQKTNSFRDIAGARFTGETSKRLSNDNYWKYHPYDRAIEYPASLYDIVTDETGMRIMYWCKYYGIYPTSLQPSLANEANGPITDMTTSVTFKYHYKLENANKTLVEFNYDAGIVDEVGKIKESVVTSSLPFLVQHAEGQHPDPVMPNYLGGAGMFTGSPYIIMAKSRPNPIDKDSKPLVIPQLRFMNIPNNKQDGILNLGIENDLIDQPTNTAISYK